MLNVSGDKSSLPSASSIESPPVKVTEDVVIKAISKVKWDIAAGQSGIFQGIFRGAAQDIDFNYD